MEKKQIVSLFLERGISLDPKGLDYFYEHPEQIDVFFEKTNANRPTTADLVFIRNILEESNIEIIEQKEIISKTISVNDISKILIERYEKIQKYFSNRSDLVNPISINKITPNTKNFSLVVIVREKDEKNKTLLVEDLTGETIVNVDEPIFDSILQDEVLGIICEKNNEIRATNVLWPDIPLKREIPKTEEDICCVFLSDLHLEQGFEEKVNKILRGIQQLKYQQLYIFLFGKNFSERKTAEEFMKKIPTGSRIFIIKNNSTSFNIENTTQLSSPVILIIEKKISLLLCDGNQFIFYKNIWKDKRTEDVMLDLLKRRHLDPVFGIEKASMEKYLIINTVPDIFVSGSFGESGMKNYKGTTIMSCADFSSEPICWVVNLRTRESLKTSLA